MMFTVLYVVVTYGFNDKILLYFLLITNVTFMIYIHFYGRKIYVWLVMENISVCEMIKLIKLSDFS